MAEINRGAGAGGIQAFRPLMPRSLRGGKAEGVGSDATKRPRDEECEAAPRDDRSKAPAPRGSRRKRGAPEKEGDAAAPKLVGVEPPNTNESCVNGGSSTLRTGGRTGSTHKSEKVAPFAGGLVDSHKDVKGTAAVDTYAAAAATAAAAAAGVVADAADAKVLSGCTVSFRHEDFVAEAHGDHGYDVICLFSVVKWMHINGGDEAVREVFQKAYRLLRPGGRLILEPQVHQYK